MYSFIRFENTTTTPLYNAPQLLISSNVPDTTNVLLKYPASCVNAASNEVDSGQYFGVKDWPKNHTTAGDPIFPDPVSFYHPKTGGFLNSIGQLYTTQNAVPTESRLVGSSIFLPPEEVDHYFLVSAGTENQVQALYIYKTPDNTIDNPEKHFVVSDPFSSNVVIIVASSATSIPTGLGGTWKAYVKAGSVPTQ